jgi:hypothetical protein
MSSRTDLTLGIEVPDALLGRWSHWFAPDSQPFDIPADSPAAGAGRRFDPIAEPELRDTFELYREPPGRVYRSLTNAEFLALDGPERARLLRTRAGRARALAPSVRAWPSLRPAGIVGHGDGHRFAWWPDLLRGLETEVLRPYVEEGRRASRHQEVPSSVWSDVSALLPSARELAGTFPEGSGPNCFATVMGAAGVQGAASTWMLREPFEEWLADTTRPGGRDDDPGTVLVWRSASGDVQHAAVTLGAGWALHKPSQGWMSPVKVLTVRDVILSARAADRRISRRTIG